MAELRELNGDRRCLLQSEHLIGRSPQCTLKLAASYVSAQHALIRWAGRSWEVLDRGSRNGTFLGGTRLESRRAYPLKKGAILSFGHAQERWTLFDADEPQVMVVALDTGDALLGNNGVIGVPSADDPECMLFLDRDGLWKLEHPDLGVSLIGDRQTFEVRGRRFRFSAPAVESLTASVEIGAAQDLPTLIFTVSSDEEFVELSLEYSKRSVPLGSRAHNYLLLTLARRRLADAEALVPDGSRGWMDKQQIADGLRITPQQVDGEVFRIRKHFGQHRLPEAATIVERRPRTKQIRIGADRIVIKRS